MKKIFLNMIISTVAIWGILQNGSTAQSTSVPIDIQFELLPKILYLDKSLNLSSGDTIKFAILYNSKLRNSVRVKDEILNKKKNSIPNQTDFESVFIPIDVSENSNIKQEIKKQRFNAIYITPIRDYDIGKITEICRSEKIISITSVPQFLEYGVSVGFDLINNKLKININLVSSKEEGADFSSRLLRIAHIIN